jgi:glucan phosphoethanolaminetransferase (alkaline phosphatase superfamily)
MIQRPQTLFYALAILGNSFVTSGLAIWTKSGSSGQQIDFFSNQWVLLQNTKEVSTQSTIILPLLITLSTIITLSSIFSFKKRMRQMTLGLINSLVLAGSMAYAFWIIFKEAMPVFEPETQGHYGYGFYALVVSLLANMIANRLVRKDEMLVQSSNRMR